ncbi:MAG: lipopolysaccharide core heptose(I) kinase RfaP [Gammaproteobacteria bacterium]|nr:lipopolysaccharide core heptose(I) kinase RfaP [Gammaproteobacteria bacterium]
MKMIKQVILYLHPDIQPLFAEQEDLFNYFMTIEGQAYREMSQRCTLRFSRNKRNFFVKQHFGVGWGEICKELLQLRLPVISAASEWYATQRLQALGIATIEVVGYGRRGWNPARIESFLLSKELTGCISLQDWGEQQFAGVASKHVVTVQLAEISRTLHQHGINHRDYYFCHLWLHKQQQKLYVMDLHRAQMRRRSTPQRWLIKDLAGLHFSSLDFAITRRDRLRFLKHYFQMPLRPLLQQHQQLLKKIEQRAIKLYKKCHDR